MTDEFLTKGLRYDRYLKALRLIEQFEEEMMTQLEAFDQQMVAQQPALFDSATEPDTNTNRTPTSGLALHRINRPMEGPRAPDGDKTRLLNVHLYWVPPSEYGRTDVEGAVRAFGYKIKYADEAVDNRVAEHTRRHDWPIETSGNPYDSNTTFYTHVSSLDDIESAQETLLGHFSEFGDEYATQ